MNKRLLYLTKNSKKKIKQEEFEMIMNTERKYVNKLFKFLKFVKKRCLIL